MIFEMKNCRMLWPVHIESRFYEMGMRAFQLDRVYFYLEYNSDNKKSMFVIHQEVHHGYGPLTYYKELEANFVVEKSPEEFWKELTADDINEEGLVFTDGKQEYFGCNIFYNLKSNQIERFNSTCNLSRALERNELLWGEKCKLLIDDDDLGYCRGTDGILRYSWPVIYCYILYCDDRNEKVYWLKSEIKANSLNIRNEVYELTDNYDITTPPNQICDKKCENPNLITRKSRFFTIAIKNPSERAAKFSEYIDIGGYELLDYLVNNNQVCKISDYLLEKEKIKL